MTTTLINDVELQATAPPIANKSLCEGAIPCENPSAASGSSPGNATLTSDSIQTSTDHTSSTQIAPSARKTLRNQKRQRNDNDRATGKLFADDFFIPILVDLFNDIQERKLTPLEFFVLTILLWQVDFERGIWTGSAYRIQVGSGGQLNLRTIQDVMKSLGEKQVIKSFHRRGQRNDYRIALNDYHVRFGKWKGYRLDAVATTDPNHPVYRTDCEATAQRQRNDSATTAKQACSDCVATPRSVRSDCVATASPIAGNTPDTPEGIPELPGFRDKLDRKKTPTTATTTITPERLAKDARPESAVVVDNVDGELNIFTQPGGDGPGTGPEPAPSEGRLVDRHALMAEIQRTFQRNGRPPTTTSAHREQAFQMAQEHGSALFLAALDHWLMTAPKAIFTVKTGKNLGTGKDKVVPRTWLLHEFMETGAALMHIDIVRPFAHVARGEVLRFLLTINENNPVQVTPSQVAALEKIIEEIKQTDEYYQTTVLDAYKLAHGMEDFSAHGTQYIQQVKDQEDADYVNEVAKTMGYASRDDWKEHKVTVSAAILKLAGQIGPWEADSAIERSGPWKGRPIRDFLRFCEEPGKNAGQA
jgi:hypothetical protein